MRRKELAHMKQNDNHRRISIRLDGTEKTYKETNVENQAYIEFKNQELAAAKENADDEFDWILPEKSLTAVIQLDEHRQKRKPSLPKNHTIGPGNYEKKNKKTVIRLLKTLPLGVIGIILSAIVVGTTFGLMMLSLFTEDEQLPHLVDSVEESIPVSTSVATKATLPTLSMYVVQGGAFSNAEKGEEISNALRNKGYAAALTRKSDPTYMFIGVAVDKAAADLIGEVYSHVGQDTYVKPYTVPVDGVLVEEIKHAFLVDSIKLYQELEIATANAFVTERVTISEEQLNDFSEKIVLLNEQIHFFQDNETQHTFAIRLLEQLTTINEELTIYSNLQQQSKLWNAQQQLLEFLITYENFVLSF